MTRLETTAAHPEPFTRKAGRVVCAAVVALATACGGSSDPAPPPRIAYSVAAQTVDTQGQPIAGVSVFLNGDFDGMSATTGSNGTTTFNFNARSADASLSAYMTGYHPAERPIQLGGAGSPDVQQLTLIRTDEAQLVLSSLTSEASADASSVVVTADIGAFDRNGNAIETLSTAAFSIPNYECLDGFFGACVFEPSGEDVPNSSWALSRTSPPTVRLVDPGTAPRYRVRFVLESSRGMFTAGRRVLTSIGVQLGADTTIHIPIEVQL